MTLRYAIAVLTICVVLSSIAGLVGLYLAGNTMISVKYEEWHTAELLQQQERIKAFVKGAGSVWLASATMLTALLIYRWFIVWSPHGRD